MKVLINDALLDVYNFNMQEIISEPTGNKLKEITFDTEIIGINQKNKLEDALLKKVLQVRIEDENIEFKGKKDNRTFSYQGNTEDNFTKYNYEIKIVELDKDLPEDWNPIAAMADVAVMNWIRTRAISNILIEKGLFSEQEYIEKINEIRESDYNNLLKLISYGIPEPKKD